MTTIDSADPASARPGYTLDNAWEQARLRLDLLEQVHDLGTFEALGRAGISAGWSCLEVGAGGGSVARWMCERVGPAGSVTAVDLEPRFLEADPRPNLRIVQRDVVADGLPEGQFDLVHCRCLLMHLPGREALLRQMLARVRPGGRLVVEEIDLYPAATAESSVYAEVWALLCQAIPTTGGDWYWARHLPTAVVGAGAANVGVSAVVPYFAAHEPLARLIGLSVEQLTPLLLVNGATTDQLDEFHAELDRPGRMLPAFAVVTVTGTRPPTPADYSTS
ncbi:MAG: class I SAM-dependent methyltransferase [Sporichthyaceae bacterium]